MTWFVRWTTTPERTIEPRSYQLGQFESVSQQPVELAVLAMAVCGVDRAVAERHVRADAPGLVGLEFDELLDDEGEFEFFVYPSDGSEWEFVVSRNPLSMPSSFVVMLNDQPVAVRSSHALALLAISSLPTRLRVPAAAFSVVEVHE